MTKARLQLMSRVDLVASALCLLGMGGCQDAVSLGYDEAAGATDAIGDGGDLGTGGAHDPAAGGGEPSSTGGSADPGTGGSSPGTGGGGNVDACPGLPPPEGVPFEACGGEIREAEYLPADVFIMLDTSGSMSYDWNGSTRWEMLTDAVDQFVSSPDVADINIGIQFFGQSSTGEVDAIDCNVENYATPAVGIGRAAEVGEDIVAAIREITPVGLTPTVPALQGAIQCAYDRNQSGDHKRPTVVLLVTDGMPTQCPDTVVSSDVEAAAADGLAKDPPVRTYVIGIEAGFNLDGIARAGGTQSAYLVEEGDTAERFRDVMLNITDAKLSCEFDIPADPGEPFVAVDPELVMMIYDPANGDPEEIPKLDDPSQCDRSLDGGWYYDNSSNPTKIRVCPCSCNRLGAGQLTLMVGCQPQPPNLR